MLLPTVVSDDLFIHEGYHDRKNHAFDLAFDKAVEAVSYDFVFSFNYYPILSNNCQRHGIPYVAYVYDSPLVALYSCSLINSCNYVFLFDKATYLTFHNAGINTVYYLPLAANVRRLQSMVCPDAFLTKLCAEVSLSVQSTMKITISMTGWTKFRILPEAIWIRSWPHSKKFTAVFSWKNC